MAETAPLSAAAKKAAAAKQKRTSTQTNIQFSPEMEGKIAEGQKAASLSRQIGALSSKSDAEAGADINRLREQGGIDPDRFKQDPEIARAMEIKAGAQFGQAVLGEEGLGRLSEDVEIQETLGRFKDISEKGLGREEVAAERQRMSEEIGRSTQGASRRVQALLAKSGVRGATAGRQLLDVELAGASERAQGERDLFLKSEQIKRSGLADFSSRLGEMKTFDLGQAAAEKNIILSSGLGFAQMGTSERSAQVQAKAQEAAAKSRASAAGGGK